MPLPRYMRPEQAGPEDVLKLLQRGRLPGLGSRGSSNGIPADRSLSLAKLTQAAEDALEKVANKATASGYASLDSASLLVQAAKKVRIASPAAVAGELGFSGSDFLFHDGSVQQSAERQARRGAASGYPSLDASTLLVEAVKKVRVASPAAVAGEVGLSGSALLYHDGGTQQTSERQSLRGQASGYPATDASALVAQAAKLIQNALAGTGLGAVGVSGSDLTFGDGAAQQTAERQARRAAASGYASLDASTLLVEAIKKMRSAVPAAVAGELGLSGSDFLFYDGAAQQTAERQARRGVANGYASLDSGGLIPVAQVPTRETQAASLGADSVHAAGGAYADVLSVTLGAVGKWLVVIVLHTSHNGTGTLDAKLVVGGNDQTGQWLESTVKFSSMTWLVTTTGSNTVAKLQAKSNVDGSTVKATHTRMVAVYLGA